MHKSTISLIALGACVVSVSPASAELLLEYRFDEGVGDTTADVGRPPRDVGTLVNSSWTSNTPGNLGSAVSTFGPGTTHYVLGRDDDKLDGLSQFTLSMWVNLQAAPSGNRRLLSKQSASSDGFSWNFTNPGNGSPRSASAFGMRLFVGGDKGFQFDPAPSSPSFVVDAANKWAFVAVSYDGTLPSNNVSYYAGSATTPVTLLATTTVNAGTTTPSDARFGVGFTDAAPTLDLGIPGFVDHVRVDNSVRTQAVLERARLFNLGYRLVGDMNDDGIVDLFDLNFVLNNFGDSVAPGEFAGDENADGVVNITDLNNVLNNFGNTTPTRVVSFAFVPEPAGMLVGGCVAPLLAARRRRRS